MASAVPSTSEGAGAAVDPNDPTDEELDRLLQDNDSGSDYTDEDTEEYVQPDTDNMMSKLNEGERDLDGWNNPEAMKNFAREMEQTKKKYEEDEAAEEAMEDAKEEAERAKLEAKKIKYVAPGLNLFTEKFLANFSAKDLSLERDFLYTQKREKLRNLGIDENSISEVLENRLKFLAYLMPEACSALISTEADFDRICNFLFFCASSCLDPMEYELLTQALFELIKNYNYKWNLRLQHIFTVLENLGMNADILFDKDQILSSALQTRMEIVEEKKSKKKWPPKSHAFVQLRRKRDGDALEDAKFSPCFMQEDPYINPKDDEKIECIKKTIMLICDIIIDMPANTCFKAVGDDWINQLTLIYLLGLLGTDKYLTNDAVVATKISTVLHDQLDSFTLFAWTGIPNTSGHRFLEDSRNDKANNACCDISEILSMIMNNVSEGNTARTWKRDELPAPCVFDNLDHHHNMVRRLQLLPLTARGSQIKKNVAFLYLQYMLEPPRLSLYTRSDIKDVMEMLKTENEDKDGKKTPVRAWFKVLAKSEHYTTMSMVRLIDMIVGNEPEDYRPDLVEAQKEMLELLSEISKKLSDDGRNIDPSQVKEIITQVTRRWKTIHRKKANESTKFITGSSKGKKKARKNGPKA